MEFLQFPLFSNDLKVVIEDGVFVDGTPFFISLITLGITAYSNNQSINQLISQSVS